MDIPEPLLKKAIPLKHIGLSEVAWLREDALSLLEHWEREGRFILGGDVLSLESDGFRHNYDNWYFNYEDGDAQQSIEHTRQYIKKYPVGDYAFVLVVG
jgi:hypothetical protein